jgi:hypothetical protein
MWICLNDAFFSIVKPERDRAKAGTLLVRARVAGDIERHWPNARVIRTPDRDYLYRAYIPADEVNVAISQAIDHIDYGNFKNSVRENWRHDAYADVWTVMHRVQTRRKIAARAETLKRTPFAFIQDDPPAHASVRNVRRRK